MKIDIGIASYKNPDKLRATIQSIREMSRSEWNLTIVHNPSDDDEPTREVIRQERARDVRVCSVFEPNNVGYAGAVNRLLELSGSDFFIYCDNDIEIKTPGWDLRLVKPMEHHTEVAQVFPGAGHYGFDNGLYNECLWSAGYCWALRRKAGPPDTYQTGSHEGVEWMDTELGHHEEVDLMIRLRLEGYRIACRPDVEVIHHATHTNDKASEKRIHAGVVRWMNKWNRYFVGKALQYPNPDPDSGEGYDPRALRYTDWPPCALYLERFTLAQFPNWNASPRKVNVKGAGVMDAVEILKPADCYKGRAI